MRSRGVTNGSGSTEPLFDIVIDSRTTRHALKPRPTGPRRRTAFAPLSDDDDDDDEDPHEDVNRTPSPPAVARRQRRHSTPDSSATRPTTTATTRPSARTRRNQSHSPPTIRVLNNNNKKSTTTTTTTRPSPSPSPPKRAVAARAYLELSASATSTTQQPQRRGYGHGHAFGLGRQNASTHEAAAGVTQLGHGGRSLTVRGGASFPSGAATTTTTTLAPQRDRTRVLSPLPVNHHVTRTTHPSLKSDMLLKPSKRSASQTSALTMPYAPRPVREDATSLIVAPRMTRRGSAVLPDRDQPAPVRVANGAGGAGKKRKKVPEETEDEEMRHESERRAGRRRSRNKERIDYDEGSSGEEELEGDEDDAEEYRDEELVEEEQEEDEEYENELSEDDHFHIHEASATQLRRLRRDELERLYRLASGADQDDAEALHKDDLITLMLELRGEAVVASTDSDNGSDSPRPFTSQETSPAPEEDDDEEDDDGSSPRKKARSSKSRRASRARRERHVPTPPPSHSGSSQAASEVDDDETTVAPKRLTRARSLSESKIGEPTSRAMTRRQSHEVVPTNTAGHSVATSVFPGKRITRRNSSAVVEDEMDEGVSRQSRNGKKGSANGLAKGKNKVVSFDSNDAGIEEEIGYTSSPIAHRTRGGSVAPPDTIRPTVAGTTTGRAAKLRAVARIVKRGERRSQRTHRDGRVIDEDDEEMVDYEDEEESEEEAEEGEEEEDVFSASTRQTRRSGRNSRTLDAPSDADEESGGEEANGHALYSETDEEAETIEVSSYLRAPRQLRNGKVVPLNEGSEQLEWEDEDEDEEMIDGEEVDLANATSKSLLRHRKDDLVRLCEEREIHGDGTKKELVQALLEWRDADFDASSGGSTVHSAASNTSTETARAETRTQALRRAVTVSVASTADTPLLMRQGHSRSPDKPHSRGRSRAAGALNDITEEINGLDLESLQLQDKEIAPEKLTKLEKVGSGGFKDVYKGLYRRKTIAICDIRGHLTEMDIKELSLLRDLRHPNIVHFIGVSIPKEPSSVPVMIVTELCANGDLFDYLRGVPHPPFSSMIDIMLGIARGVEYLHTRKPAIIHRDIKSSNVLITAQGVAKMADFGLARVKHTTRSVIRSLVGTVNWQAPELWVAHPKYNEKVDVYSVGLVFWEVLQWHQPVKRYPFEGLNEHAIYDQVGHKKIRPSTASMRRQWGGEILDLVGAMWDQDHAMRPSMKQVVLELEVLHSTAKEQEKAQKDQERSGRSSR